MISRGLSSYHEIIDSILTTDVVESADVRMIQAGDSFGFALETFAQFSTTRKMRRQNCDGDNSVQTGVSGAVNLTHPTSADTRLIAHSAAILSSKLRNVRSLQQPPPQQFVQ